MLSKIRGISVYAVQLLLFVMCFSHPFVPVTRSAAKDLNRQILHCAQNNARGRLQGENNNARVLRLG
jgi:hypothetical protein